MRHSSRPSPLATASNRTPLSVVPLRVDSVSMMEAEYEDAMGKMKTLGPRTPLSEVVAAGEVVVLTKTAAQQHQRSKFTRAINGGSRSEQQAPQPLVDDDDLEPPSHAASRTRGSAVAVRVAPRPVAGARAFP